MKSFVFWFEFHCLFPRAQLTINQHWCRLWLGGEQATSHYLNQSWPSSLMHICSTRGRSVNTLRPSQNGHLFTDNIFKCIFLNENEWILIQTSLNFVPKGTINNILAMVQIMVWDSPGAKPLLEPMMVRLLMHICITQPQWVNSLKPGDAFFHLWTWSSLVQVMVCYLFSVKPLPKK